MIQLLRMLRLRLLNGLLGRKSETADRQEDLVRRLREDFKRMPQTTCNAHTEWQRSCNRLRELVLNSNPRKFLTWDIIAQTMFLGNEEFVGVELNALKESPDWNSKWKPAVQESPIGKPKRYPVYPSSSANLIHHAYHAFMFERTTSQSLGAVDLIVEFGGGYGSLCRLIHHIGFKGTYVIYDLPPFSALQRFYLKALDSSPVPDLFQKVVATSDLQEVASIYRSNLQKKKLCIATWSISEVPVSEREPFLSLLPSFDAYLFAYQNSFHSIDNVRYFEDIKKQIPGVNWYERPIDHIRGSNYLFGLKS